jgi:hypothetical protein
LITLQWSLQQLILKYIPDIVNNSAPPLNSNGLAVAFVWLWLLPVIISWLQVGPRCNPLTLNRALQHANRTVYAATANSPPVPADLASNPHAISVSRFMHSLHTFEHAHLPSTVTREYFLGPLRWNEPTSYSEKRLGGRSCGCP